MHLVGFIIRIYDDARSFECQILITHLHSRKSAVCCQRLHVVLQRCQHIFDIILTLSVPCILIFKLNCDLLALFLWVISTYQLLYQRFPVFLASRSPYEVLIILRTRSPKSPNLRTPQAKLAVTFKFRIITKKKCS